MPDQATSLTVLFADISGSTGIVKQHGDRRGREIIGKVLDRVTKAVQGRGGRIVDRIGDELMCALPEPEQAVLASIDIQDTVADGALAGEYPTGVRMHIGLHHGPVVIEGERIFGDTIHTAKRMVDMAKAEQILTTQDTLANIDAVPAVQWRLVDEARIKGHVKPVAIFELLPEGSSMTVVATGGVVAPRQSTGEHYLRCTLKHGSQMYVIDLERPTFSIGRDAVCDLPLPHGCVSREHGRLEFQKGRIIFVDHSTNGTFVNEANAPEMVLVHREQRWLRNTGLLRFGTREDEQGMLTLEYACEEGEGGG